MRIGFGKASINYSNWVNPLNSMKYYGSILDLQGFAGPVVLVSNLFTQNVIKYFNCDVSTEMLTMTRMAGFNDAYTSYGPRTDL